jgi:integrase
MSDTNSSPSTVPCKPEKPSKPAPDFPLFPHASGQWAKKIRGKLHYFGKWDNPDAALAKYDAEKDDLHAGRKPRELADGALTVKELANAFLNSKQALVDAGELSVHTWADYKKACDLIVSNFGKGRLVADVDADDFAALRNKMSKRWGFHRVGKTIQCVRCVLKHAFDAGLIDRPVRYGPGFDRPSKKTMRLHRAAQGARLFTAEELRAMIGAAGVQLKAMLLLAINCGFGNSDCCNLPLSALDLDGGWTNYPRPKTGVDRRCPLWKETVSALRAALAKRPDPKNTEHAGLVFLTQRGGSWGKDTSDNPVSKETAKLLKALGINGHRNFYTIRHTFRTVADEARDQPAADYIMGHESMHMSTVYRERISDQRLKAVSDYVRAWLFPPKPETEKGEPKKKERKKAGATS